MRTAKVTNFPELSYACAEAINTLCTNLTFAGNGIKRIMITSCHASEGKSTISMNVLRTMASLGKRVCLLDMDLRRSLIVQTYGIRFDGGDPKGSSHYLAGQVGGDDVLYELDIPGAFIVPVTKRVSSSLSLLNSNRLQELIQSLGDYYDYVIVDAPPIGALIDAAQIARFCDGTLLVINYNEVRKKELMDAKAQLDQTGCPILGTVINQARFDSYVDRKYYYKSYYYTHYDHYYTADQAGKPAESKTKKSLIGKKK